MPQFACSHCGQQILADDSRAGTVVTCPSCEKAVMVPKGSRLASPQSGHDTLSSRPAAQAQPPRSSRGKGPKKDRTTLIALGITALAMVLVLTNVDLGHRMVFGDREEIAAEFRSIGQEMRSGTTLQEDGTFEIGAPATTNAGRLRELILGVANDMIRSRLQYEKQREALGLPAAFAMPGPYFKDASPPETDLMLTKTAEAARAAKQRGLDLLNGLSKRVKDSDLNSSRKRTLLRALEETHSGRIAEFEQMWQLELAYLEQAKLACAHVHGLRGTWVAQGNKLAFVNAADATTMNEFLSKMREIRRKQLALQQVVGMP